MYPEIRLHNVKEQWLRSVASRFCYGDRPLGSCHSETAVGLRLAVDKQTATPPEGDAVCLPSN